MIQPSSKLQSVNETPSHSRTRLQILQQQQQMIYNQFNLDTLCVNKKLNINSLKDKILKFKKNHSTKNQLHSELRLEHKNELSTFYQPNNQKDKQKDIKQKLQRIPIPRSKLIPKQIPSKVNNQNTSLDSTQVLRTSSHARNKFQSTFINETRQQVEVREKKIHSHFQNYQTMYQTPQFSQQNKINLQKIKRQKTQQNQHDYQNYPNNAHYQHEKKNKNYHSFKIQPITSLNKQKHFNSDKNKRYNRNDSHNSKAIRSTQKSFIASKDISRITYSNQNFTKKILITSQYQLDQLQTLISNLWSLYQSLTTIMQHAQDFPFFQEKQIQKYVEEVCSDGFQILNEILMKVNLKRLNRGVKMSKMLQNLSIVYLALQLTKKKKIKESHIVNFIGYCTSNIIFIIRILDLVHELSSQKILNFNVSNKNHEEQATTFQTNNQSKSKLKNIKVDLILQNTKDIQQQSQQPQQKNHNNQVYQTFQYSSKTLSILQTIRKFQINSYKQELKSLLDVIIRMQHNNQIINILQNKLCLQSQKDLQIIVIDFLKKTLRDQNQPYFSYARYIFQFLAFHIAKFKLYGILKCLEVAPQPYLNLKYQHTIVIEPYQVFVFQKKTNILIRAHTQKFINTLSKSCNIVIWSDLMPAQIQPILSLFPKSQNIHTLYRYHCIYDNEFNTFIKPLQRLGGSIQNILIIDRDIRNFINNKSNGIEFSWKGEKKDGKLLDLLQIIESMVSKNCSLRKSLMESLAQVKALTLKKKTFQTKRVSNMHHMKNMRNNQFMMSNKNKNNNNQLKPIHNKSVYEQDHSQLLMMIPRHQIQHYEENQAQNY